MDGQHESDEGYLIPEAGLKMKTDGGKSVTSAPVGGHIAIKKLADESEMVIHFRY